MEQTLKTYPSPRIKVPRTEAIRRIREQIEIGRAIKDTTMLSMMDLDGAQKRRTEWLENQTQILPTLFNQSFLEEGNSMEISSDIDSAITFGLKEKYFKDDINEKIGKLESILELLRRDGGEDFVQEPVPQEPSNPLQSKEVRTEAGPVVREPSGDKITRRELSYQESRSIQKQEILFIHGEDGSAKESVLEFVNKLGLQPLTFHEEEDKETSLVEHLQEISNINFAIVLFTRDSAAAQKETTGTGSRAMHDILFEFGYVLGKLGRERVCVLRQEGVETPLNYPRIMSIPMDPGGGWMLLLAKEFKQAGIEIDLNRAI